MKNPFSLSASNSFNYIERNITQIVKISESISSGSYFSAFFSTVYLFFNSWGMTGTSLFFLYNIKSYLPIINTLREGSDKNSFVEKLMSETLTLFSKENNFSKHLQADSAAHGAQIIRIAKNFAKNFKRNGVPLENDLADRVGRGNLDFVYEVGGVLLGEQRLLPELASELHPNFDVFKLMAISLSNRKVRVIALNSANHTNIKSVYTHLMGRYFPETGFEDLQSIVSALLVNNANLDKVFHLFNNLSIFKSNSDTNSSDVIELLALVNELAAAIDDAPAVAEAVPAVAEDVAEAALNIRPEVLYNIEIQASLIKAVTYVINTSLYKKFGDNVNEVNFNHMVTELAGLVIREKNIGASLNAITKDTLKNALENKSLIKPFLIANKDKYIKLLQDNKDYLRFFFENHKTVTSQVTVNIINKVLDNSVSKSKETIQLTNLVEEFLTVEKLQSVLEVVTTNDTKTLLTKLLAIKNNSPILADYVNKLLNLEGFEEASLRSLTLVIVNVALGMMGDLDQDQKDAFYAHTETLVTAQGDGFKLIAKNLPISNMALLANFIAPQLTKYGIDENFATLAIQNLAMNLAGVETPNTGILHIITNKFPGLPIGDTELIDELVNIFLSEKDLAIEVATQICQLIMGTKTKIQFIDYFVDKVLTSDEPAYIRIRQVLRDHANIIAEIVSFFINENPQRSALIKDCIKAVLRATNSPELAEYRGAIGSLLNAVDSNFVVNKLFLVPAVLKIVGKLSTSSNMQNLNQVFANGEHRKLLKETLTTNYSIANAATAHFIDNIANPDVEVHVTDAAKFIEYNDKQYHLKSSSFSQAQDKERPKLKNQQIALKVCDFRFEDIDFHKCDLSKLAIIKPNTGHISSTQVTFKNCEFDLESLCNLMNNKEYNTTAFKMENLKLVDSYINDSFNSKVMKHLQDLEQLNPGTIAEFISKAKFTNTRELYEFIKLVPQEELRYCTLRINLTSHLDPKNDIKLSGDTLARIYNEKANSWTAMLYNDNAIHNSFVKALAKGLPELLPSAVLNAPVRAQNNARQGM